MTLTVHHLHISQSERIVWLCEELAIDYELKTYKRAPVLAPPEYKALHPQETAPVIQDGDVTLAESGACIEYICHQHAEGRLFLPSTHPAYADFLYWWHWGNGTFMPTMMLSMALRPLGLGDDSFYMAMAKNRFGSAFAALNERLRENVWLAGGLFTVADVMVVFVLTTLRYWFPYSLDKYENVVRYLKRVGEREAYRKAMKKCEPELEPALGVEPPKKES
ncbi:glutathione S-transferase [Aspergillus coremiiformis]|uniref:Glutathione S-transferase n=1 Tax=Aspergillus coremiiformis TaxID=138285 RepID=A0A5N6Z357_9EURO|nr:glutathione S-transferase [Aspergillus coremiiformis]